MIFETFLHVNKDHLYTQKLIYYCYVKINKLFIKKEKNP